MSANGYQPLLLKNAHRPDSATLAAYRESGGYRALERALKEMTPEQVVANLPSGPINADDPKVVLPPKSKVLTGMEELIHQFIIVTEGIPAPSGEVYQAIEAPKGELGFYIKSEGDKFPYRMKIRSPSFVSLQAVPLMAEGMMVSDLIAIVASLDPVMGEVDR